MTAVLTPEMRAEMRRAAEAVGPGFGITVRAGHQRALLDERDRLEAWLDNANQASAEFESRWHKAEKKIDELKSERDRLAREERAAQALISALVLQAQGWATEARGHKASLHEAYQAVTGATGEPGNWNGARPIVEAVGALRAALDAERERSRVLAEALAPFAQYVLATDDGWAGEGEIGEQYRDGLRHSIKLSSLRRAATALQRYKDGEKAA